MGEKLYQKRNNPTWYAEYYDAEGERVRRCCKTRDRRQAERLLRLWTLQASDHRPAKTAHTVSDAGQYLTDTSGSRSKHYEYKCGHFIRLLGDTDVNALTLDDVTKYTKAREEEGAARTSIGKELKALGRALRLAARRDLFLGSVERIMPEYDAPYVPRKRFLTPKEFELLMARLTSRRQLWVWCAVYTGGRREEINTLAWENIRWSDREILLSGTKTAGAHRTVSLHPALAKILQPLRRKEGPVVERWWMVVRDLEVACRHAGIDPVTPNDLRRTFASWLKQGGVDSAVVARLLGHSTTAMVDLVYGQIDAKTRARAIRKLPSGLGKKP